MGLLDTPLSVEIPKKQFTRRLEATANSLLKGAKPTRRARRKRHKMKIPKMTYRQYMGSAYWKKRKNDYFGAFGKVCAVCSEKSGVTLHHKIYDSSLFGKEPNEHLVALCPEHHQEFHTHHKLCQNMAVATDRYIAHARQFEVFDDNLDWI